VLQKSTTHRWFSDNRLQLNDVRSSTEVFQNLYFALNFFLFHRLHMHHISAQNAVCGDCYKYMTYFTSKSVSNKLKQLQKRENTLFKKTCCGCHTTI